MSSPDAISVALELLPALKEIDFGPTEIRGAIVDGQQANLTIDAELTGKLWCSFLDKVEASLRRVKEAE